MKRFVFFVTIACSVLSSRAQPCDPMVVSISPPSAASSYTCSETFPNSRVFDVDLYTTNTAQSTIFTISYTGEDMIALQNVTIHAFTDETVRLRIQGLNSASPLASVDSIDMADSTARVDLERLLTTGNVGNVEANSIGVSGQGFVVIGGNVTGAITLPFHTNANGSVQQMRINGHLFGDLIADYGRIDLLVVDGDIGTTTPPWPTIQTAGNIGVIDADSVYAQISTTGAAATVRRILTRVGDFDGSLSTHRLASGGMQTTDGVQVTGALKADLFFTGNVEEPINAASVDSGSEISIGGGLIEFDLDPDGQINIGGAMAGTIGVGDVTTSSIAAPITIGGGMSGTIRCSGDVLRAIAINNGDLSGSVLIGGSIGGASAGSITVGGTGNRDMSGLIRIGTSIPSTGSITVGTSTHPGLLGQVIINANNATGTWSGNIRVNGSGSSAISHDAAGVYSNTATSLGGGAVGLVRFNLHGNSCVPPNHLVNTAPQNMASITVRHYGPILDLTDQDPNTYPVTVRRRLIGSTGSFLNYGSFTVAISAPQSLLITAGLPSYFVGGYEYEVLPVSGLLKCANTTVDPAPDVQTYSYRFFVQAQADGPGGGD